MSVAVMSNYLEGKFIDYVLGNGTFDSPPALPTSVNSWLIHQTGEKYSGKEVGVSSYYVDSNRWNGDVHSVLDYFGYGEVEPEVPITDKEKLDTLWAWYEEEYGKRSELIREQLAGYWQDNQRAAILGGYLLKTCN